MLIISYDKKLSLNVGNHWYYKFTTDEIHSHCNNALIKEFFDLDKMYDYDYIINCFSDFLDKLCVDEKEKLKILGELSKDKNKLFVSYDIISKRYRYSQAYQQFRTVITPYNDIVRLNQPKPEMCNNFNDYISKLPSIDDIKEQFPTKNSEYNYDKYGFPEFDFYFINLELQIKSDIKKYMVGIYTDKTKFESANQKVINILKKGGNYIDFSEL